MFDYIYLQVLLLGQHHLSCFFLGDLLSKERPVVCYDGLDTCLVVQVLRESFTFFGSHQSCLVLKSLLAYEEILHIDRRIHSFYEMLNEWNVLSNVER